MSEELQEALNLAGDAVTRDADGTVRLVGSECTIAARKCFRRRMFVPNACRKTCHLLN